MPQRAMRWYGLERWRQRAKAQLRSEPLCALCLAMGVRRDKAALSDGCKSDPAAAPAGSNRSSYGGNEVAEAFGVRVTNW
jgi:hypothetical protein